MKHCTKCGEQKPLLDFTKRKSSKDGLDLWCKSCKSTSHKNFLLKNKNYILINRKRAKKWNRENKERRQIIVQKNNYKKRYGLSVEQKQELINKQDSKCAICTNDLKDTHDVCVDHNHVTGAIRGILCRKCNLGIGHLNDSIEILKSAQKYLQKYAKKSLEK
jgi:hypothetical protein